MHPIIIAEGPIYRLTSWGRGLSYALRNKSTGLEIYVQGDDATTFLEEWDKAENFWPHKSPDEIGDFMWSDLEYGTVATEFCDD